MHWSPDACVLAASAVAALIRDRKWMKPIPKRSFTVVQQTITLTGDLWRDLNDPSLL